MQYRSRKDGTHHPITPAKGVSLDSFLNLSAGGGKTFGSLADSDSRTLFKKESFREPDPESLRSDTLNSSIIAAGNDDMPDQLVREDIEDNINAEYDSGYYQGQHLDQPPAYVNPMDDPEFQAQLANLKTESVPLLTTPDAQRIAEYKEKMERKADRYRELSSKKQNEAKSRFAAADYIADGIPMGQPILVGHHSERRHRRDIERMHSNMSKGIELQNTSKYYENKVKNIENPRAISTDDPEAVVKLKEKLKTLEDRKAELLTMKLEGVSKSGKPYSFTKDDVSSFRQNLTRDIYVLKKRIDVVQSTQAIPQLDKTINGIQIVTDKDDNRLRMHFPGKPSTEIIQKLKSRGFKWSPFNQAWQRHISNQAIYLAEQIAAEV